MSLRRRPLRAAAALAVVVLAVAGWATVGPRQLGGPASYAVIVGSSMEPGLHRGDLAIVRRRDTYRVGDVVLYEDARLGGARILHRIVAVDGERFRTKGDNNDYLDSAEPGRAEVLGALSVRLPGVGGTVTWLRQPAHAAVLVALATLLALGWGVGAGAAASGARARGRRSLSETVTAAALAGAALAALLAAVAWKHPSSHVRSVPGAYAQAGSFDYGSRVAPSAVYPDGRVDAGEPVFLRIAERLRVAFRYRLEAPGAQVARGTAALEAVLADGRGWERRLILARERPFAGGAVVLAGSLDLRRLEAMTAAVQRLTGSDITTYSLLIRPEVTVEGRLGEAPLHADFAPELPFVVDPVRMALDPQGGDPASLLAPRQTGAGERRVADRLALGPVRLEVADARLLSLGALLACLLAAAVARARTPRDDGSDHDRIVARHGHLLVEAALPAARDPRTVTELADFESLARLAERSGRAIVHASRQGAHEYVLDEGGAVFRYRTGSHGVADAWLAREIAQAARL